jgi:predicted ribosome quality control (RQC) complex YloA/Tae2 family protein
VNEETMEEIVDEVGPMLEGRFLGRIFQLSTASFAFDFGLRSGLFLFISSDPAAPRAYFIKRRARELEKEARPPSQFAQLLRAKLSGAALLNLSKTLHERVLRFSFRKEEEPGKTESISLIAQLTGRSANLFLVNEENLIMAALRLTKGSGQLEGTIYDPPQQLVGHAVPERPVSQGDYPTLSAALDAHYQFREQEQAFQQRVKALQGRLRQQIRQKTRLNEKLESDLVLHGDPQQHKQLGDLILANLATAQRSGTKVLLQDFYSEGAPLIELQMDENTTLQEEATRYFTRYTKAKRAREEIANRLSQNSQEIDDLLAREMALERILNEHDEQALSDFAPPTASDQASRSRPRRQTKIPGVRIYKSSDGYEILVGRGAVDNDHLTFRVAKPNDLWLHSADYPGSHVIVRRHNRNEIPHRTVVEAAQLAARFSQASKDAKVVVHYTARKFISKPKGVAPGLVRMSTFKTIVVEPKESVKRAEA